LIVFGMTLVLGACEEPDRHVQFEDAQQYSIYTYLMEHQDIFSSFIAILEQGGLDKTLSAYNPDGPNYTLFLPDNEALDRFIQESDMFNSLDDILENVTYCEEFSRYHVLNMAVHTQDFPFGAFPEPTLSGDYLTVSFIIEQDTSYYKINNQAAVTVPNIRVSNGYIHQIAIALKPITFTTYEWLGSNGVTTIFKDAVDLTGNRALLDFNVKEEEERQPVTLLVEPDAVYMEHGIHNAEELAAFISPDDPNYTDSTNPLNAFVRYHILTGSMFLNDFEDHVTNYTTYSEVPLNINGKGIDIMINKGKEVFDTLVQDGDTTLLDYITFFYDESNVLTQSGAVHLIDQVMTVQPPSRADVAFSFWEEPLLNNYRKKAGTYLIDDPSALYHITWEGADLFFVKLSSEQKYVCWNNDYLQIDGDFIIRYSIPKIVQGKYIVYIGADAFSKDNAMIEVYIDGKKVSNLVDLTKGGNPNYPFRRIKVGVIDFKKYDSHVVEVRSLIPGRFLWDYVYFEPEK